MFALALLILTAMAAAAQDLPAGQIIDSVKCGADPSQSYALYVPKDYTAQRLWPVILAFDPRARGKVPVEIYQAAAEKFGYIIAGSNNSQNGSWAISMAAAQAMTNDVFSRFSIDPKRVYAAGMSGGSRVALGIALESKIIAGVIASSASYPDAQPRKTVPFPIFGTAGTEDFNYLEMRRADHALTSPHRLAAFDGGHVWLSSALALEAVEWMDMEAMKAGRTPRDQSRIDQAFARRTAAAAQKTGKDLYLELEALATDFTSLKDVSEFTSRAAGLQRDKQVREALKKDRSSDENEQRQIDEILAMERQLIFAEERSNVLMQLRDRWKKVAATANGSSDSPERRMARRILRGLTMGADERTKDMEYRAILASYRPPRPGVN